LIVAKRVFGCGLGLAHSGLANTIADEQFEEFGRLVLHTLASTLFGWGCITPITRDVGY
jgi:hypothetical protein